MLGVLGCQQTAEYVLSELEKLFIVQKKEHVGDFSTGA